jgi:hypothetical protein
MPAKTVTIKAMPKHSIGSSLKDEIVSVQRALKNVQKKVRFNGYLSPRDRDALAKNLP